jgi:hypothetical protein
MAQMGARELIIMVKCPTCGWNMQKRTESELGGFVFGHYFCESFCPTTIKVKSPTKWMVETGRWESEPLSTG